ncbi:MAG: NAD(P)/FAD-dependent oxidoreductase [Desulfopila sp.]|jgi:NAD(P)H-nitrite reductase large subunit|nr:NAD(P)/FAD-dependent oxidoreductase [Desulfopila sp.]
MLKDGEKGVILQRDKETYAIAPHVPCGIITPEMLEKLAAAARKYNAATLKITSAARIALIGLREEDIDAVWRDLGSDPGHAVGLCVRSVKVCPGTTFCRLAKQDSIAMGMKLDRKYHGTTQPSKMKMAVSGCKIQCGENCIKDLSLYGTEQGWTVLVGGMGGIKPRLAEVLVEDISTEEVEEVIEKTLAYYRENSKRARLGFMIEKIGIQALRDAVIGK